MCRGDIMKIRKIAQIKNVGVFKNHSNNSIEFQDINFIYANNASGKTTLVDILKDLSEGKDGRIKEEQFPIVENSSLELLQRKHC